MWLYRGMMTIGEIEIIAFMYVAIIAGLAPTVWPVSTCKVI